MKPRKALIFQHTKASPPGTTLDWLESREIPYEILYLPELREWPRTDSIDLLILCGGGMNVDEEHLHPWLKHEKEFLRRAIGEGLKIVGLCLGAQLLAEVLGAQVKKHPGWEIGWQPVRLANGEKLMAFEFHGYSFSLPPGAIRLATNDHCREQAYRFGSNVLGYQFHPETTAEVARARAEDGDLKREGVVQTREEILAGIPLYQSRLQAWYHHQLDEFCAL